MMAHYEPLITARKGCHGLRLYPTKSMRSGNEGLWNGGKSTIQGRCPVNPRHDAPTATLCRAKALIESKLRR